MFNKFSVKNINTINVGCEYSPTSKEFNIVVGNKNKENICIESINKIREISKLEKIKSYHDYFYNFSKQLNIEKSDKINWGLILGKTQNNVYLKYLKSSLESSKNLITTYHHMLYPERIKVYQNLTPVMLNKKILELPVYNHSSTTGRTSIISGCNFLTMKKEKRNQLKSCNSEHVLVEIDLKSCEPSFYLNAIGRTIDSDDVYQDIANKIKFKISDRAKFKRGILSVLYGANKRTSKNILKCSDKDLKKIKEYFEIDRFSRYLKEQFEKNNMIYNYYGRPICYNNSLVNYWIQSSSVDYCSFAFANLLKQYNVAACFFVHDSITVSINKKNINSILALKKVYDNYSNISIPVEVSVLSR